MKILGSVTPIGITPAAAAALKIKEGTSFFHIPSEILEKYKAKKFDIIDSDSELMLVAQSAKAEPTNDKNKTTSLKELVS